jgi:hypothetical protein
MPVVFATEPLDSRTALADGLAALAAAPTPAAAAHLAAVAGASAPPPLPVYPFALDDLAAGRDPRGESQVAWVFLLVVNDQAVRTAEVVPAPDGKGFAFAAISAAEATAINQGIAVAEADKATAKDDYELRLVRVPALYVTALWLKHAVARNDRFVVIPPVPDGFHAYAVTTAADFLQTLRAAALRRQQATPPAGPSPTN